MDMSHEEHLEQPRLDGDLVAEIMGDLVGASEETVTMLVEEATEDSGGLEGVETPSDPEEALALEALQAAAAQVFAPDPLQHETPTLSDLILDPDIEAQRMALRAGVTIVPAETHLDVAASVSILNQVFLDEDASGHYYPPSLLRNIIAAGAVVLVAWDQDVPLGTLLCLPAWGENGLMLQSGPMAVLPEGRGRGISTALKLAQRAWCLERGLSEIRWSFDLLTRSLARLNLHTLRAEAVEFLPGFEGERSPGADTTIPNDRLLVRWDLTQEPGPTRVPADYQEHWAVRVLDGVPVLDPSWRDHRLVLVELPRDVHALRVSDPALAALWQREVGEVLKAALESSWELDVDPRGHYRLVQPENV